MNLQTTIHLYLIGKALHKLTKDHKYTIEQIGGYKLLCLAKNFAIDANIRYDERKLGLMCDIITSDISLDNMGVQI